MPASFPAAPVRAKRMALLLAVIAVALLPVAAITAQSAEAGAKPLSGPRALAVSVPPDPVTVNRGSGTKTLVRIVNPNRTAVEVTVAGRQLALGDNGNVSVGSGPDPLWQKLARFPTRQLRIPARGYLDIPLTIRVPRRLAPDLYFIGFLVTPVAAQVGGLRVINPIGSFVTIDVAGPRVRKLAGVFDVPSFVLGSHVNATMRIANTGRAAVRFWGENDTTASPGRRFQQLRLDPSLLPAGRSRLITVTGRPAWPIGMVTMTTRITYPGRTEAETKQLIFSKRVLVIAAWVPIALAAILLAAIALVWARRRRRRSSPEPTAGGPPPAFAPSIPEPRTR